MAMVLGCPDCGRPPGSGAQRRDGRCRTCWSACGGVERMRGRTSRSRAARRAGLTKYRLRTIREYEAQRAAEQQQGPA